jgi:uncharacterized ParB-like nuclease family protein
MHCLKTLFNTNRRSETVKTTQLDINRISGPNPPSDQRKQVTILESSSGPTAIAQVLLQARSER